MSQLNKFKISLPLAKNSAKWRHWWLYVGLGLALLISTCGNLCAADLKLSESEPGEPGVGWQNSPFLKSKIPLITSWGDPNDEEKEPKNLLPPPIDAQYTIAPGDTLRQVLAKFGIGRIETARVIKSLSKTFKPRNLRPGHRLILQIQSPLPPETQKKLVSIDFTADATWYYLISR